MQCLADLCGCVVVGVRWCSKARVHWLRQVRNSMSASVHYVCVRLGFAKAIV